jgi:Homeodomain-like domain
VHRDDVQQEALALIAAGISDSEVARRLGIPRTTVRDWRRPRYVRQSVVARCHRCWRPTRPVRFEPPDYAELLGLYLGDGYICPLPRTERLRIFLDARYGTVVDETEALLRRCFPANRVGRLSRHEGAMVVLWVYHGHLSCLFPQHGIGKKHDRRIALESWQEAIVAAAPWAFLKGCIRSDGCVFVNRTGRYAYLSYDFTNRSADIRELFVRACDAVGVDCRPAGERVKIYRRASVALLREHVGIKA